MEVPARSYLRAGYPQAIAVEVLAELAESRQAKGYMLVVKVLAELAESRLAKGYMLPGESHR